MMSVKAVAQAMASAGRAEGWLDDADIRCGGLTQCG